MSDSDAPASSTQMNNRVFWVVAILLVLGLIWVFVTRDSEQEANEQAVGEATYQIAEGKAFSLEQVAEVPQATRMVFTPNRETLLVSSLTGEVHAFQRTDEGLTKQATPFVSLSETIPGFPPEESGLTSVVLGVDFEQSGDVFLLYQAREGEGDEAPFKNRIARVTFATTESGDVVGENLTQIFEANVDGQPSHQIQGGVGVLVRNEPHLLFNIGEGFEGERAQNALEEAGKVLLIQRDGSEPLGIRPWRQSPVVQAVGLRNAYAIAQNPYDPEGRFLIGDTGTSANDRLLYAKVHDSTGLRHDPLNLAWDGSEESLLASVVDGKSAGTPEVVLHRWDPTETATDIAFYPGGVAGLPVSDETESLAVLTMFGKTGQTGELPGRTVQLARLSHEAGQQPAVTFETLVERSGRGRDEVGHPVALAVDSETGDIYFSDIMEGRIYKVSPTN
ncbi:MAG: PQQ-dependent sugar dehydrogenase [Candidatus Doudnabacteria bacterium]|nr:PQQ-dependent sugar dehydrogenase [Candidatus Doudnabacteria bacterium]